MLTFEKVKKYKTDIEYNPSVPLSEWRIQHTATEILIDIVSPPPPKIITSDLPAFYFPEGNASNSSLCSILWEKMTLPNPRLKIYYKCRYILNYFCRRQTHKAAIKLSERNGPVRVFVPPQLIYTNGSTSV